MLKLIALEMKKFKLGDNIKGIIIANISLLALVIMMGFIGIYEEDIIFSSFPFTILMIDLLVRATFIIFSSVLLAKLVIDEYKNKTMNLMFMYPINRKKIFMAKFIIVIVFAFANILISNIFLILMVGFVDRFFDIVIGSFTMKILISEIPMLLLNAGTASLMVLIPLYFGIKKMSVATTIVSSILLVCVVCSGNSGFTLSAIPPVIISIAVVGVLIGGGVLRKLENQDVL